MALALLNSAGSAICYGRCGSPVWTGASRVHFGSEASARVVDVPAHIPAGDSTLSARGRRGTKETSRLDLVVRRLLSILLSASVFVSMAVAADDMAAFPAAEAGMTRYVINLPSQRDENAFEVELSIGKTVKTDAVNHYFFGGTLDVETIPGWGFDRYILRQLGPMAGTLMAVDPNAPKVERFVSLGGPPHLVRYNSRLPLVIYVPTGVDVRYRVWRADQRFASAKPA
jgi:ecotin